MESNDGVPLHLGTLLPIHFADATLVFHGAKHELFQEVFDYTVRGINKQDYLLLKDGHYCEWHPPSALFGVL